MSKKYLPTKPDNLSSGPAPTERPDTEVLVSIIFALTQESGKLGTADWAHTVVRHCLKQGKDQHPWLSSDLYTRNLAHMCSYPNTHTHTHISYKT